MGQMRLSTPGRDYYESQYIVTYVLCSRFGKSGSKYTYLALYDSNKSISNYLSSS